MTLTDAQLASLAEQLVRALRERPVVMAAFGVVIDEAVRERLVAAVEAERGGCLEACRRSTIGRDVLTARDREWNMGVSYVAAAIRARGKAGAPHG